MTSPKSWSNWIWSQVTRCGFVCICSLQVCSPGTRSSRCRGLQLLQTLLEQFFVLVDEVLLHLWHLSHDLLSPQSSHFCLSLPLRLVLISHHLQGPQRTSVRGHQWSVTVRRSSKTLPPLDLVLDWWVRLMWRLFVLSWFWYLTPSTTKMWIRFNVEFQDLSRSTFVVFLNHKKVEWRKTNCADT